MRLLLDALLQGEGTRYGVAIQGKKVQQAAFVDNETLEHFLRSTMESGWDAYHACALFGPGGSREAANALVARALWLDVDAGSGKNFDSEDSALSGLAKFVRTTGLPEPTVVGSGYGWHAYWFLKEPLSSDAWRQYATALKALTPWADQSRTADIASILRTPETWNFKRGGKAPVILGPMRGPYGIDAFRSLLTVGPQSVGGNVLAHPARTTRSAAGRLGPIAAAAARIYGNDLVDAETVADGCAQLGAMRSTRGLLPEPVWKACLGVLALCKDGEELAHEWSVGDPRYDPSETQGKFDRSAALGAPTTCAHFQGINPAGCSACPFRGHVSTPVQLARAQSRAVLAVPRAPVGLAPHIGAPSASYRADVEALPSLPPDFIHGDNGGLFLKGGGKNGEPQCVSRYPVHLVAATRGELKTDSVTLVLRHLIPSEGYRDIEIPFASLFSSQGNSVLAGRGIAVENADAFRKFVRDSYNDLISTKKLGSMFEQCGWKNNDTEFLVGNRLYKSGCVEDVPGTPELHFRSRLFGPRDGGSLEGWKAKSAQLFGVGREASTFAMLCGFAAPLIRFLSTTEGGAVVSIVSRESGQGKSLGIDGATSIWGDGEALRLINGDTQVARAISFGVLGNLPCVLDDIAHRDAEQARDFIQRFTDGRDKLRGTREGELRHLLASWQTILITSSNDSLIDAITSLGGTAAMAYRVLQFNASLPANVDKKQGEQWKRDMLLNWGHAGDAYLKYLLQPTVLAYAKDAVRRTQAALVEDHDFNTEHRFWTRTLACVFVAHAIAHTAELVSFPVSVIRDWAIDSTRAMGGVGKPSGGFDRRETANDILSAFIGDHIDNILTLRDASKSTVNEIPMREPKGKILMRYEVGSRRLFVREDVLRQYLAKRQFSWHHFQREMEARGSLIPTGLKKKRSLTLGTTHAPTIAHVVEFNTAHPDISGQPALAVDNAA